jgi:hypothetical protein
MLNQLCRNSKDWLSKYWKGASTAGAWPVWESKEKRKNSAASFFPESDEEMENEKHWLPVATIVAEEIRKYQLDNGWNWKLMVPATVLRNGGAWIIVIIQVSGSWRTAF